MDRRPLVARKQTGMYQRDTICYHLVHAQRWSDTMRALTYLCLGGFILAGCTGHALLAGLFIAGMVTFSALEIGGR